MNAVGVKNIILMILIILILHFVIKNIFLEREQQRMLAFAPRRHSLHPPALGTLAESSAENCSVACTEARQTTCLVQCADDIDASCKMDDDRCNGRPKKNTKKSCEETNAEVGVVGGCTDELTHDQLKKFVFDDISTGSTLHEHTTKHDHTSTQSARKLHVNDSNTSPDTHAIGYELIQEYQDENPMNGGSLPGGLNGFCADANVCSFAFL
jgi:hypothetical protein